MAELLPLLSKKDPRLETNAFNKSVGIDLLCISYDAEAKALLKTLIDIVVA